MKNTILFLMMTFTSIVFCQEWNWEYVGAPNNDKNVKSILRFSDQLASLWT